MLIPGSPNRDQLGGTRLQGPLPDAGAVEAIPFQTYGFVSHDGDTIPDVLEGPDGPYPHLDSTRDDSTVDTDGDGSPDAEEIGNMTDLYDPSDRLQIVRFRHLGNGVFEVAVDTFPGLRYRLESGSILGHEFPHALPGETATDFATSFEILLDPELDFVRALRDP